MQNSQAQFDKSSRPGNSINWLKITKRAQIPRNTAPWNECTSSWLKRTSRGTQFQLSTILLKYEVLKLVVPAKLKKKLRHSGEWGVKNQLTHAQVWGGFLLSKSTLDRVYHNKQVPIVQILVRSRLQVDSVGIIHGGFKLFPLIVWQFCKSKASPTSTTIYYSYLSVSINRPECRVEFLLSKDMSVIRLFSLQKVLHRDVVCLKLYGFSQHNGNTEKKSLKNLAPVVQRSPSVKNKDNSRS